MTWDELRRACLALPGAIETFSFGPGCSVFKAPSGKMFAVSVTSSEPLDVSLKCDPELAASLRHGYDAIVEGYHLNKRHGITVTLNADVPDAMVLGLIEDSYELVMPRRARPAPSAERSGSCP
jgi:predicted DNA-binding protein (MmcQ/YjbR family)